MIILFDYDGTLHDTASIYGEAFRCAYRWLVSLGYAQERSYSNGEVSKYLGMTIREMWQDFMPDLPNEIRDRAAAMIGNEMTAGVERGEARLYDGIPQVLDELKLRGHTLIVLTNGSIRHLNAHRACFGLDRWFSDYYCASDWPNLSKAELYPRISEKYGSSCCMIGDRDSDMEVGIRNGIPVIGCSWGFGKPEELECADAAVKTPYELLKLPILQ